MVFMNTVDSRTTLSRDSLTLVYICQNYTYYAGPHNAISYASCTCSLVTGLLLYFRQAEREAFNKMICIYLHNTIFHHISFKIYMYSYKDNAYNNTSAKLLSMGFIPASCFDV